MIHNENSLSGNSLKDQLAGYRLTTAQIFYHLPDYPKLLQEFVWQHFDLAPEFPELKQFLTFWERKIDGQLHSVNIASVKLISPGEVKNADGLFVLN